MNTTALYAHVQGIVVQDKVQENYFFPGQPAD